MLILKLEHKKHIILTYQLEKAQIDLLRSTLQALNCPSVIADAKNLKNIHTVSHFMAFLNFDSLDGTQEQVFFAEWQNQATKNLSKTPNKMPTTYIINCNETSDKGPNLFTNRDVFADKERLRLILLQRMKAIEGDKLKGPVSPGRLIRILEMYHDLAYNCCLTPSSDVSTRRFYQDMSIVKMLVPSIKYDKRQKKYIATHLPDKEESRQVVAGANIPSRIKRVLLIYQQLLYDGWITREVAEQICDRVSLRMFQRDLAIIDGLGNGYYGRVVYDMEKQKYILKDGRIKASRKSKKRNPYLIY